MVFAVLYSPKYLLRVNGAIHVYIIVQLVMYFISEYRNY